MDEIISPNDLVLVTGATGFVGASVVRILLRRGLGNIRCLARPSSNIVTLEKLQTDFPGRIEITRGNLLSKKDCQTATAGAAVIYHLAAGTATKSFADAFANSVVTTRNLLDAAVANGCLRRLVSVSSFAVYDVQHSHHPGVLDEACPVESRPEQLGAYGFAKCKQDELIADYGKKHRIPYVLVRPGVVYGPGKKRIHGRVGLDTFGLFLHLGGSNQIPLTFVDNCANAIVLAGLKPEVEGQVFNIVDDNLPSSRQFLERYKSEVGNFRSLYIPHFLSYLLCFAWEKYSGWSHGQLPPVYNRKIWANFWKRTKYPNEKAKRVLGWTPTIPTADAMSQFFDSCRKAVSHA